VGEFELVVIQHRHETFGMDGQAAHPDDLAGGGRSVRVGEPEPGLHLGRTGGGEQDVVQGPVGADRGQAALGDHGQHRAVGAGRLQQLDGRLGVGQFGAGVDEHDVGAVGRQEPTDLRPFGPYGMGEQVQGRQGAG